MPCHAGKEPTWGADYTVVLSCTSKQQEPATDGATASTVLVPNVSLGPGKYLLQLELVPELCEAAVDPVTGVVRPAPAWTLQLTPNADEKVSSIGTIGCVSLFACRASLYLTPSGVACVAMGSL